MIAVLFFAGLVAGGVGGSLGSHRYHVRRAADLELEASMAGWFRDRADQLVDQLDVASHLIKNLSGIVADQAVITRAALGRAQKRRIPGGST